MNGFKRFALTGLAALTLGLGTAKGLEAATLRVPSQYATIQQAVDASQNGDEVLVAPGIYTEVITITNKALTLKSESGYANTEIRGPNQPVNTDLFIISIYNSQNLKCKIDGFRINANNNETVYSIGISDHSTGNGELEICNNLIEHFARGVCPESNQFSNVHHNIFRDNYTYAVEGSQILLNHNLIYNSQYAIGINGTGTLANLTNNTIINNRNGSISANGIHFSNNIFANSAIVSIDNSSDEGNNIFYRVPLSINGSKTGCPNLELDPLFCDLINNDFTLHANSPALPQNNECNTLIGAFGENCESTPAVRTSWGKLKTIYR